MQTIKERMALIVDRQPDDASYDEIIKELAFERMIAQGLADSKGDRTISNEEMKRKSSDWQK
ncbi:MAG: hypothetical protein L3J67_06310 [Hyphomicrobiaceae bacterium]|nr:hypothetical protein [Hyphomicrobiaceae bacterium]